MNDKVKRYADGRDLETLKYIFVDALDVDPTFVQYEEEYNYCKKIPGLLEDHIELTPFTSDKTKWTEDYWASLKMDLVKNFSDRRMTHMREVAKVYLADKMQRILAARQQAAAMEQEKREQPGKDEAAEQEQQRKEQAEQMDVISEPQMTAREKQAIELEEAKKKLAQENALFEREQQKKEKAKPIYVQKTPDCHHGDESQKKTIGLALAALAAGAVILILLLK